MYHIFMYTAALLADIVLIFFNVTNVVSFDELKNQFIEPVDLCRELNPFIYLSLPCRLFSHSHSD